MTGVPGAIRSEPLPVVTESRRTDAWWVEPLIVVLVLGSFGIYALWVVLAFLWWDALQAFRFPTGFGIGLGTLLLVGNAALLSLYSLSCHSCRHLCGGGLDSFRGKPLRSRLWRWATRLNERHPQFAW